MAESKKFCVSLGFSRMKSWLGEARSSLVEMYRTFNMGIGMVLIIPQQHASEAVNRINAAADYKAQIIGEVVPGNRQVILP